MHIHKFTLHDVLDKKKRKNKQTKKSQSQLTAFQVVSQIKPVTLDMQSRVHNDRQCKINLQKKQVIPHFIKLAK